MKKTIAIIAITFSLFRCEGYTGPGSGPALDPLREENPTKVTSQTECEELYEIAMNAPTFDRADKLREYRTQC